MNLRIKKLQFVTIYDVTREKVIQKLTFAIITIAIYLSWLTHLSFKDAREMAGLAVMGEDRKMHVKPKRRRSKLAVEMMPSKNLDKPSLTIFKIS